MKRWVRSVPMLRTFLSCLLIALPAAAEVVRIEIRETIPFAGGREFGAAGAYERISGRLWVALDPEAPANARVHDLRLAPRNAAGRVEGWTDFCLLKPVQPGKGNGRLLYDVANRGNKLALWTFNGGERSNDPHNDAHAGNGFLMRAGWSLLWTGWNGEVQEDGNLRMLGGVPPAGQGITGPAHLEISTTEKVFSRTFSWSPWGISAAFPAADLDNRKARLTMRPNRFSPAVELPSDAWAFARWENGKVVPDATHVYVRDGFKPGWLYDLVYTASQPRVNGFGLAALRDAVAFFRHAERDTVGNPNPMRDALRQAVIFGISQSGRLGHHFLYEGFNTDETGRQVFEGALLHVAGAGRGSFNHRFRMTTDYATQHEGHLSGSELFPFAPTEVTDPETGRSGDSMARLRAAGHVPKIIFTQSSTEYWNRAASLLHTDPEGKSDLKLPPEVRIYLVAGSQHLGGGEPTPGICQQPRNPLDDRGPVLRALLVALERWLAEGQEPPPSRYPRLADGTLVTREAVVAAFPKVPGLNLPGHHYEPARLDFGPRFDREGIADLVPPTMGKRYRTLLPAVNADGNETSGIVLPEVAVPLGTYAGWNLRAPEFGAPDMLSPFDGMFLPFAKTAAERAGDPRPSVRERYPTRADYLDRITRAALQLQSEGFLLAEDVVAIIERAAARDLW
jgi:hypothetical protein